MVSSISAVKPNYLRNKLFCGVEGDIVSLSVFVANVGSIQKKNSKYVHVATHS